MAGNQNLSSLRQYIDEASRLLQSGRNGEAVSILTGCVDSIIPQDGAYRAAVGLLQEHGLWNESLKFLGWSIPVESERSSALVPQGKCP